MDAERTEGKPAPPAWRKSHYIPIGVSGMLYARAKRRVKDIAPFSAFLRELLERDIEQWEREQGDTLEPLENFVS